MAQANKSKHERGPGGGWRLAICAALFSALVTAALGCQRGGLTRTPPTEAELPGPSPQGANPQTMNTKAVKIVTYNTHLLPEFAINVAGRRGAGDYRATAIPGRLAEYDVIGLCETFDNERTDALLEGFQQQADIEWHVVRSPERTERLSAGGLLLLSRYPIEASHWLRYQNNSGIAQDGLAAKGALHGRLRIAPGEHGLIDCFLTHLDSQVQRVRLAQVQELAAFMTEHAAAERPLMLLGDLNITADPPGTTYEPLAEGERPTAYRWLMEGLQPCGTPLVDAWAAVGEGAGDTLYDLPEGAGRRVDYILFGSPPSGAAATLTAQQVRVLPLEDDQVPEGSLSDHAAVECRAEFAWPAE